MSESESHDMDEQSIIYEEEEVLWAKIRGYPWWPAFVDKVHGAKSSSDDQIQYTVFFFGDNTHSRLGGSKLRRFLDYYTEFFPKAKTNRKLYLSIMKAEEKLRQNGGNTEIFQTLRNTMKKPKKGRGHHKTQSKIDSQDHANHISQQPQLVRNKTLPINPSKQRKQAVSQEQGVVEQEKPRRTNRKSRNVAQKEEKQQSHKIEIESESSQSIQQEKLEKQQIEPPKVLNYRTRSGRNRKQTDMLDQQKQSKSEEKKQSQQQSQIQQPSNKNYPLRFTNKTKPLSRGAPKKRGRPKKIIEQNNQSQSEQSQQQLSQNSEIKNPPQIVRAQSEVQNRKLRNQRNLPVRNQLLKIQSEKQKPNHQATQKCETSDQTRSLILERVKFCLDKRAQLIEYLDQLNVTTDIVKDILDLDVTTIILESGETTADSIRVLQKLKSALLHRYFPDDIKIRKKYEKLSKKTQSLKTSMTQAEESLDDLELRRKTLIKLQKILKNSDESNDQKERAIEVESYFRKYDESIGNGYKTIAYKVLRSLKDRSVGVDDVVSKLEAGEFDDEQK